MESNPTPPNEFGKTSQGKYPDVGTAIVGTGPPDAVEKWLDSWQFSLISFGLVVLGLVVIPPYIYSNYIVDIYKALLLGL